MSLLTLPALQAVPKLTPRRTAARCCAAAAPRALPCAAGAQALACRASPLLRARVVARSARLRATRRTALPARASAELVADEEKSITKACGWNLVAWLGARRSLHAPPDALDPRRRLPQFSFGTIGLSVGLTLLLAGFLGYFNFIKIADNSLSALLLIYGFPISLIGAARLRSPHVAPVPG